MKLESKVKVGSKEIKKYDEPRSPYHRLIESEVFSAEVKAELRGLYGLYKPVVAAECQQGSLRVAGGPLPLKSVSTGKIRRLKVTLFK
jgi:hypothetical protein